MVTLLDQTIFPLDDLLDALLTEGFQPGLEARFRIRRWLDRQAEMNEPVGIDSLKYKLGALLTVSAEAQHLFYEIFDQWAAPYWEVTESVGPLPPIDTGEEARTEQGGNAIAGENESSREDLVQPLVEPAPLDRPKKPTPTSGRSGPIRIELLFPDDGLRLWNTPDMVQAIPSLREKEWTAVREWDIKASIHRTIRSGGIPAFVYRFRKKAPRYLVLIDQKSPRDHLAGLYADLVLEMNRRDLDAEYYFYDEVPYRCWRDPRDLRTYTNIESLQSEFPSARLLLIGDVDDLLDFPDLRPRNLVVNLLDNWLQVALLTPKSTADWGDAERVLCALFPIVPANAAGLATLLQQWNATVHFTPDYWLYNFPEPSLPEPATDDDPDALDAYLERVYYYLGESGFQWLCASVVYPEIYWELTKLLHDESIPPDRALSEWDQNQVWQIAMRRLGRIPWFRQGHIPQKVREYVREQFESEMPEAQRAAIREQLLNVLILNESRFPPGSFAEANRAFTIAWYEYQRAIAAPNLSEAERARIEAEFREKGMAKIQLSEIEDSLGRRLFADIEDRMVWPPVPDEPGFHVLWVDDKYEIKNLAFKESLLSELRVHSVHVRDTDEALAMLAHRGFHLIVSDVRHNHNLLPFSMNMLNIFNKKRITTSVVVYTSERDAAIYGKDLILAGALEVVSSENQLDRIIKDRAWSQSHLYISRNNIINLLRDGYLGEAISMLVSGNEPHAITWQNKYFDADEKYNKRELSEIEYNKVHSAIIVSIFLQWMNNPSYGADSNEVKSEYNEVSKKPVSERQNKDQAWYNVSIIISNIISKIQQRKIDEVINDSRKLRKNYQYQRALEILSEAFELYPSNFIVMNELGITFRETKRLDDAINILLKSVEKGNIQSMNELGITFREAKRFDDAINILQKSVEKGNVQSMNELGITLREAKRLDEAIDVLQKAVDRGNIQSMNELGITLREAKRYDEAIALWEKGRQIQPQNAFFKLNLLQIHLFFQPNVAKAKEIFWTLPPNFPKSTQQRQMYTDIVEHLETILACDSNEFKYYRLYLDRLAYFQSWDMAVHFLEKLTRRHAVHEFRAWLGLALSQPSIGRSKEGIPILKEALQQLTNLNANPRQREFYHRMAIGYLDALFHKGGKKELLKALDWLEKDLDELPEFAEKKSQWLNKSA